MRDATIRLDSGKVAKSMRARGKHRFGDGVIPNDLTISRKNGHWYASITLRMDGSAGHEAHALSTMAGSCPELCLNPAHANSSSVGFSLPVHLAKFLVEKGTSPERLPIVKLPPKMEVL